MLYAKKIHRVSFEEDFSTASIMMIGVKDMRVHIISSSYSQKRGTGGMPSWSIFSAFLTVGPSGNVILG